MTWIDLERAFHRALLSSFSWGKALLVFPALALCGVLIVFCRALRFGASEWMGLSLIFLPILLSFVLLLSVGVLVIRVYQYEQKSLKVNFKKLLWGSLDAVLGTAYLSIPPVLIYLLLWMVLGVFFLMKEIPGLGMVVNTVFVFAPFLLILSTILLCLLSAMLLFFVAPLAAKFSVKRLELARVVLSFFKQRLLLRCLLFVVAVVPGVFFSCLLAIAASLTNLGFSHGEQSWTLALEWFFMMIPFAALLTPAVIFFFQFAFEAELLAKSELAK